MKIWVFFLSILLAALLNSCNSEHRSGRTGLGSCEHTMGQSSDHHAGVGALLASRIDSLADLHTVIHINYSRSGTHSDTPPADNSAVHLRHCSNDLEVTSNLAPGVNQGDLATARDGGFWERLKLIFRSPYAIRNRVELNKVNLLARRLGDMFGADDVAFYNIAQATVQKINTEDIAYLNERDRGEKGYQNTFNHITAQAMMTSIFGEKLADFIADIHERHSMPALTHGNFTREELTNPNSNPVDHYVDIINNEWGQELGKQLKARYSINEQTDWTPQLLSAYLNDLQSYYSWAFQIGFEPFRPDDEKVVVFARKLNTVMATTAIKTLSY